MYKRFFLFICGIILFSLQSRNFCQSNPDKMNLTKSDKEVNQIVNLEIDWLKNLHNKNALDTILADDFVHVLPQGIFITKSQHINWIVSHPLPSGYSQKFDTLSVRIYGKTGIANGIVETVGKNGESIRKSIFTDVFVKRNNRWQAVNAQENLIK